MASTTDRRPPQTGDDEKSALLTFLDYLREAVVANATGIPTDRARAAGVPSGTSLAGLVKHLTAVERFYFLGEDMGDMTASFRVSDDEDVDTLITAYREAVDRANSIIRDCGDLGTEAPRAGRRPSAPTMRWVLVHMVEETARHAGHGDILREQLNGTVGR